MFAFVTCPKFSSMERPFHHRHMFDPCGSDWSCASLVCSSSAVEQSPAIQVRSSIGGLGEKPSEEIVPFPLCSTDNVGMQNNMFRISLNHPNLPNDPNHPNPPNHGSGRPPCKCTGKHRFGNV
jgi:hypothetical protein